MTRPLACLNLALALILGAAAPGSAQENAPFGAADIEAAQYAGGDLPAGRSAITAKVQVLLDRSGISPGVIDGFRGGMSESAIRAFERRSGLPEDGIMDSAVWNLLQPYAHNPITATYAITDADAADLVAEIPTDYAQKAAMSAMGYTSLAEKLGERFHMDDKFIAFLNPGVTLQPGAVVNVTVPAKPLRTKVARILIDKSTRRVTAFDADGRMIVDYPATIGSGDTPSPSGSHTVVTVALNPNYTYNPDKNFRQAGNDKPLIVPPGPNGPVGSVWIDLSKPTYGIHGTPTPSQLFRNQSHGCVRLTNWDAEELAHMVQPAVTTVEFLEPGVNVAEALQDPAVPTAPVAARPSPAVARAAAAVLGGPVVDPEAGVIATDPVHEDTTEENAPSPAPGAGISDPLGAALSGALPEGFVAPLVEEGQ